MLFIRKKIFSLVLFSSALIVLILVWNIVLSGYDLISKNADHRVIKKIQTDAPKVALTFDDGPHPCTTLKILSILQQKQVKATFFVLGEKAESYPKLIEQINKDGHELSNHGYSHAYFSNLSEAKLKQEILATEKLIANISGKKPVLLRPPGNYYNSRSVAVANELGYIFVLWSIDTRDWSNVSVNDILHEVEKARPGDIILLHDGRVRSKTVEALPIIIDTLQSKGYQLVTLSDLLLSCQ